MFLIQNLENYLKKYFLNKLMKMKLKEIKLEVEVIENIFKQLERIKKPVPFKGGLSQFPLVVGLVGKIPDSINNLVSKFVGYKSKPTRQLTEIIEKNETINRQMYDGLRFK